MAIPFILAGLAVVAGGYGVKKGLDAKEDFDIAESRNNLAQRIYNDARDELVSARKQAEKSMTELGKLKFQLYETSLIPFVNTFAKIKNINFDDALVLDKTPAVSAGDLKSIRESALAMTDIVTGGIVSLGAGGLAGLAAYGGVGLLGTASTGTAIGALSGVAATNATLAWLGGGSLAAGGFGMAGGMAVLGGIVAGPVLAVGGMMLASKAEEARYDSARNLELAGLAVEQMKLAFINTKAIQVRFEQTTKVLQKLEKIFTPLQAGLQLMVAESDDYSSYTEQGRKGVMMTLLMAKTMRNIIDTPLIGEDGTLTEGFSRVIEKSEEDMASVEKTFLKNIFS